MPALLFEADGLALPLADRSVDLVTIGFGFRNFASYRRGLEELVGFLFRESSFPKGCILLTGTGIVPPDSFTLAVGDLIEISIDGIGVLSNPVEQAK